MTSHLTAAQVLQNWGVGQQHEHDGMLSGRWRGASVRVLASDSEAASRIDAAFHALEHLPNPLSVAEVHLERHDRKGSERQFVPVVSRTEGLALLALSGDSLLVTVDRDTGSITILGRDGRGRPLAVEHKLPKASMHGAPARSVGIDGAPAAADDRGFDRRTKLDRLLPHLRCVRCAARAPLARQGEGLACAGCGAAYPLRDGVPVILPVGVQPVEPRPDATSSNTYSHQAMSFFETFRDGLVLDCGCGKPVENLPNVVHLEIVPYPNVDVVATSDAIPFAEGTFAAATCEAVLEHVPDPWTVVDELHRVLAVGGVLRVDAPFVAPFHAYPDHYHNFTQSGLERLLSRFERLDGGIGPHQEPWLAIGWILRLVRDGLPDDTLRGKLDQSTIGELTAALSTGVPPEVLHPLSDEVRTAIAAGFFFYGRKPAATSER